MVDVLKVVSVILVALAMVPALAHALEYPGKLRLTRDAYFAVQPIYYPGFTIAGISEPVAIIATAALLLLTPSAGAAFWLTLVALVGLVGMHGVYWLFTHPVNNFWLQGQKLGDLGAGFFSLGKRARSAESRPVAWTELRDRWEYSHVARAALSFASFIALAVAISSASGA